MSYFAQLLATNNLPKHDGRALWRYGLSKDFFLSLQQHLRSTTRLFNVDPRDCALYYAAWWKWNYNGSSPSKQHVFSSIYTHHSFNEKTFFDFAKVGATRLGIHWIRNQSTLYFRTLLLQGGLPVNHISNNKGDYTKFLTKILEMKPVSIDDFAFDASVTSLLPTTSRNDEIYACCLEIVNAILRRDEDYLSKVSQDETIDEIRSAIEVIKPRPHPYKSHFRSAWVFEPSKACIRLYLSIPSDLELNQFVRLFFKNDSTIDLAWEFTLFCSDELICKFTRTTTGNYKRTWSGHSNLEWNGSNQLTELYLLDSDGKKLDCSHIVNYSPQLNYPSLWSRYSDTQWILERGRNTSQQEALVLLPNNWQINESGNKQPIALFEQTVYYQLFDGEVTVTKGIEIPYRFKSKCSRIDWIILSVKPDWIKTANLPVVRGLPKISVYNGEGEVIPPPSIKKRWRQKGENIWHQWIDPVAKGLIELSIEALGIVEQDEVFNIGNTELRTTFSSLSKAEITIDDTSFLLTVTCDSSINITRLQQSKICLEKSNNNSLHKSIHASLSLRNQHRSLLLEINSPFKGIEVIDNQGDVVADGTTITIKHLGKYQLLTNERDLVVNLYNLKRPSIILSKEVETSLPLKHFEVTIQQLYSLSDPIDGESEIVMEVGIERNYAFYKKKEYRIRRYDQEIVWQKEKENVVVKTEPSQPDLYAIPVDCSYKAIELYNLERTDGGAYILSKKTIWDRCVVFSSIDSAVNTLPAFLNLENKLDPNRQEDWLSRVDRYRNELLNSKPQSDIWKQLLTYYATCENHSLSFATFDIIRACSYSSELSAKLFLFLLCNATSDNFMQQSYRKLENDLGFFFHWISGHDWNKAIDWVGCIKYPELVEACGPGIKSIYADQHPVESFSNVFQYINQGKKPVLASGYFINQKINAMREELGIKVQKGIPKESPSIPKAYQHILPITNENQVVQLMLTAPVAVALSIAGKDNTLWLETQETARRNVKYVYDLQLKRSNWNAEAIIYALSKI